MGCSLSLSSLLSLSQSSEPTYCQDCGIISDKGPYVHVANCKKNTEPQCSECGHINEFDEIHVCG